jgi:hypothetical protein
MATEEISTLCIHDPVNHDPHNPPHFTTAVSAAVHICNCQNQTESPEITDISNTSLKHLAAETSNLQTAKQQ